MADACLDYGLVRLQYSAFLGDLSRSHQRALWEELRVRVQRRTANIQLFPLNEQAWTARRSLWQEEPHDGTEHV